MYIIGIDPGTARVGWGVIVSLKGTVKAVAYGCITTPKTASPSNRLLSIYQKLNGILSSAPIQSAAIEELFFSTNAKTIVPVGESRGVALLACAQRNIPVVSYSPPAIKRAICGHGQAPKDQVERMVVRLLKLPEVPKPDDTADALAIALTHAYSYPFTSYIA